MTTEENINNNGNDNNEGAENTGQANAAPAAPRPTSAPGGFQRRSSNLGARGFRPAGGNQPGGEGGPDGGDGGRPPFRRPRRPGGKDRFAQRRRVCQFCVDKVHEVEYKDFQRLRRYLSDRGKIEPRRKTGTCAKHQRSLTTALKRGRYMALLPYVSAHTR